MPVKNILVVDDSPTERMFAVELLTKAGYSVITADSGEDGIAKAKANKPDLFKNTTLTYAPKGPGGSFTTVQSEGFGIFKDAKNIDAAKGLLEYTLQPEWYVTFIEQLDGRYGPVYKSMIERPFWQQPRLKEIAYITKNGRILAADGAPLVAFSDIANKFYIPTMIADVLVKKVPKKEALASFLTKAKEAYAKNPPK